MSSPTEPRRRHPAARTRTAVGAASAAAMLGLTGYLAVGHHTNVASASESSGDEAVSAAPFPTPTTPAPTTATISPATSRPTTPTTSIGAPTFGGGAGSATPALPSRRRSTFSRGS